MHVADVGLVNADDSVILERAVAADEVIITADADFGMLLALGRHGRPSVVLLRSSDHLVPDEQTGLVLHAVDRVGNDLATGAVVSITPARIRVRPLPMAQE